MAGTVLMMFKWVAIIRWGRWVVWAFFYSLFTYMVLSTLIASSLDAIKYMLHNLISINYNSDLDQATCSIDVVLYGAVGQTTSKCLFPQTLQTCRIPWLCEDHLFLPLSVHFSYFYSSSLSSCLVFLFLLHIFLPFNSLLCSSTFFLLFSFLSSFVILLYLPLSYVAHTPLPAFPRKTCMMTT